MGTTFYLYTLENGDVSVSAYPSECVEYENNHIIVKLLKRDTIHILRNILTRSGAFVIIE